MYTLFLIIKCGKGSNGGNGLDRCYILHDNLTVFMLGIVMCIGFKVDK